MCVDAYDAIYVYVINYSNYDVYRVEWRNFFQKEYASYGGGEETILLRFFLYLLPIVRCISYCPYSTFLAMHVHISLF